MNSVGQQRLRRPPRLAQRALPEHPGLRHAVTSCTSPATRSRVRPVASRNTSSSVGSASSPRRSRSSAFSCCRRALAHDQAVVDDRQPVAQLVGLLEVLRGEEDGRAALVDAPHLVPHRQPARGVEAGRRLVEEQHLGPVHERRREVEPALHAARVALDPAVGRVLELDQLEQLLGARRAPRAATARTAAPAARAARARSGAGRARPPAARRRSAAAPRRGRAATSTPATRARARRDRQQRRQHPHGRRLAGAVRARGSRTPRRPRPAGRRRARPRRAARPS